VSRPLIGGGHGDLWIPCWWMKELSDRPPLRGFGCGSSRFPTLKRLGYYRGVPPGQESGGWKCNAWPKFEWSDWRARGNERLKGEIKSRITIKING